ncbi:hypothetical protein ANANG_G00274220 [Anguilla anguilla]|uniref:Myosin motor domain-containing protein n=1 Tax=Anguilla anguilla TaxID=7936 RepID=A0A9D3RMN4_ANGAN|nr:hypothetical protein ANANG_G00274220 [Anguilla anguilla]
METTLGDQSNLPPEEKCQLILQKCQLQGWQMGGTKVFLRYWQADHLSDRCHQLHRRIVFCQKVVRGWLVRRMSDSQREACSIQRFLQGAEDQGLQAYDSLVIQNASDIARENDRVRNALNGSHAAERPEPLGKEEEPLSRASESSGRAQDGVAGGGRLIRHYRSSSGPLPLALENLVQSAAASSIKTASREPARRGEGRRRQQQPAIATETAPPKTQEGPQHQAERLVRGRQCLPGPGPQRDPRGRAFQASAAQRRLHRQEGPAPETDTQPQHQADGLVRGDLPPAPHRDQAVLRLQGGPARGPTAACSASTAPRRRTRCTSRWRQAPRPPPPPSRVRPSTRK